jgi:hypothetical protein
MFAPPASPEAMISTRRLCCRPATVMLLAKGFHQRILAAEGSLSLQARFVGNPGGCAKVE